jgi:hypothetical protein
VCRSCLPVLAAACAVVAAPLHAAVYKWTDANGRVIYSNVPPSGDVKVERVNTPGPANPDAARQMQSQDAELKKRQLERTQEAEKAEKTRADTARRDESCSTARGNIKALQNEFQPIDRVNEKGERVRMDAAARPKERERLEQYVRTECQDRSAATR